MTSTPDRALTQRMEALHRANVVRVSKAKLKRDLKAGHVTLADVLFDPPECVLTAKVLELLLATPKVGRVKAQKALVRTQTSPSKTVGGLTHRQRHELVMLLRP